MTDETAKPEGAAGYTGDEGKNALPPELQQLVDNILSNPKTAAEEMKRLRGESKERRLAAEKAERDRAAAEQQRLEQEKQFEQLSVTQKQELERLRPLAEQYEGMRQLLSEMAQKRVDGLPKQYRSMVPDYDDPAKTLAWLDANAATFTAPAVPNTGAGVQGDATKAVKVTDEANQGAAIAARYGFTLDPAKIAARAQELKQRTQSNSGSQDAGTGE